MIFMGQTDPDSPEKHKRQSMVLVPMDTPGVTMMRSLKVFGYDDAPHGHGEVDFKDVRVPVLEHPARRGARASRSRRGGSAPAASITACAPSGSPSARWSRSASARWRAPRSARASPNRGVTRQWIAESRMEIDQSRLLTLHAAHMMDTVGNKAARREIAMIKVVAPKMAQKLVDRAIQVHGGGGVSQDFHLAYAYARTRTMRIVDGPDAVHEEAVARLELRKYEDRSQKKR
jgi:acyl-CoA dehydrogenase